MAKRQTAAEYQAKVMRQRKVSSRIAEPEVAIWLEEHRANPKTTEIAGSPMADPMIVEVDYSAGRKTAAGDPYEHGALDIIPVKPTPNPIVTASMGGRVLAIRHWDDDSGYTIAIGGNDGLAYSYAHLKPGSEMVAVGDHVTQKQPIGIMGDSGRAKKTHPHLHYTVKKPRYPENETPRLTFVSTIQGLLEALKPKHTSLMDDYERVWPTINGKLAIKGDRFENVPSMRAVLHLPAPATLDQKIEEQVIAIAAPLKQCAQEGQTPTSIDGILAGKCVPIESVSQQFPTPSQRFR